MIVPLGLAPFFTKRGYTQIEELDWWQGWTIAGLGIKALPVVHFSGRGLFDRAKTIWASYAIEVDGAKIWFSGDTVRREVFDKIGELAGPFDYTIGMHWGTIVLTLEDPFEASVRFPTGSH